MFAALVHVRDRVAFFDHADRETAERNASRYIAAERKASQEFNRHIVVKEGPTWEVADFAEAMARIRAEGWTPSHACESIEKMLAGETDLTKLMVG